MNFLFGQLEPSIFQLHGLEIASCLLGVAFAWLAWQVMAVVTHPPITGPGFTSFELARREALRSGSAVYRWFEPVVDEIARWNRRSKKSRLNRLQHQLLVADESMPWKPEEFMAVKLIEGIFSALAIGLFLLLLTGKLIMAAAFALPLLFGYPLIAQSSISNQATRRLHSFRLRLPFAVDLIALMLEAGANFLESLETVVRENQGHPLGEELQDVVRQIAAGRPRSEALAGLQERLRDDDVSELVFAINTGEEFGTPLSAILRRQAEQMRLKRSQWGEKAAAQAQVQMVFPGTLVMVACLLVVMAPLILPAVLMLLE